ncbi:MAG: phosphate ABC transporter, permease protein PstA [Actinobacteria bacterium HGW-Actinobacteria-4]|nr:MAG: phosphate ABC transporter, permease protein PstA [Actinobacteria bacterium HGW-Actinobacteria-4]
MTTTLTDIPAAPKSLKISDKRAQRRKFQNSLASIALSSAMVVACIPLILILFVVIQRGIAAFNLDLFIYEQRTFRATEEAGFAHGFVGTALIMALAIPMAVLVGISTAVYLVEYGRGTKLATAVRFVTDVMTGVPSIFVGLVVYAVVVRGTGLGLGFGTLAGAIAIALVMLPIVVRSCEEMLKLVPDSIRNASAGLGSRKWQTTTRVVLPASAPGLATGSMLAVARGAGETAPLLLTALGSLFTVTELVGRAQASLPQLIYQHARQPFPPGLERAWGGALALVIITLLFTILARTLGTKYNKIRAGM